ncbi:MAG: hypothetical protein ACT4OZ_01790 [Gemmatimonadota bacterium]
MDSIPNEETLVPPKFALAALALVTLAGCSVLGTIGTGLGGARAGRCVVGINRDSAPVRVTEASRRACVLEARVVERELPLLTNELLREGPPGVLSAGPDDMVHCRYKPGARRGGSLKFHCIRTDDRNRLMDESGELVAGATDFDSDGKLLDSAGRKLRDGSGNSIDGHELHVKYFLGPEPAPRYREMFTETVVSRLFLALGIPADAVYMPAGVACFGCTANPSVQKRAEESETAAVFRLASIKLPYDGKKIAVAGRDGFLGLGGRYDHGWSFREIGQTRNPVEVEMQALALNLVAYNNLHSVQNDLRCRRGAWDPADGTCGDVVAYVSDVGGTLGGRAPVNTEGASRPVMPSYPRGDFITYAAGAVFSDRPSCRLFYEIADVEHVSEKARGEFAGRIRSRVGREQLRAIFEAASIERMDGYLRGLVAARYDLSPGEVLDSAVRMTWVEELEKRMAEIVDGRCP